MNITVINGTEKRGVTYQLKEIFLAAFRDKATITEYDLPRDCPHFCSGCVSCIINGEHSCKGAAYIAEIEQSLLEADLIVMTSPAYVFHTTGAMKAFLDHFAYRWIPHRPAPEMFGKRAIIITQCLGAGAKSAAKDIRHSLSWWGISKIVVFTGALMSDIVWEKLSEKKRTALTRKIQKLSQKFTQIDYAKPARTNGITKAKFLVGRLMQQKLHKNDPAYLDGRYWAEQGWLGKARPWRP
ncbi:MAG: NAD(P)H-dependent oxidoreductase [Lachnospiraceae bacterium]|jgi:multimeric flavodoxin WrbA|nr:NAD(P)H-dependent oxidoreductase [Lachnospiraceae bacterium]